MLMWPVVQDHLPFGLDLLLAALAGRLLVALGRRLRAVVTATGGRRIFTNGSSSSASSSSWSHQAKMRHPATFHTLAVDPATKRLLADDLDTFRNGKDLYAAVGRPWKRGYLLSGPPGSGKSTLIAAMANYLDYNVYDLDLTVVRSNFELRKLLVETARKSVIVMEGIDDLIISSRRRSKVTLSGLLNVIDGLWWSACAGGERIIVFTTTRHKDELPPALIRRGRMDIHVDLSYCRFDAFKIVATTCLNMSDKQIDEHELSGEIRRLLEEVDTTPADVAEKLMMSSSSSNNNKRACLELEGLVEALNKAKKEAADQANKQAKDKGR